MDAHYCVSYDPGEEILITVGVSEGLDLALRTILNPGDEVLVPDPVWLNYIHVPNFFGAKPVSYSLLEENDYQIDLGEIEKLITPKTKMMVINSPCNPTGVVQSKETLEKLADIAKKHADDISAVAGLIEDIIERCKVGKALTNLVNFIYLLGNPRINKIN